MARQDSEAAKDLVCKTTDCAMVVATEPVTTFLKTLASVTDMESLVPVVEALVRGGDREAAFLDDTLPSIIQRRNRITSVGAATDFLLMVQYLQLVFKYSKCVSYLSEILRTHDTYSGWMVCGQYTTSPGPHREWSL